MDSPQLLSWDAVTTPPQRLSAAEPASSPALSVSSKTFSNRLSSSSSTPASSPALRDSAEVFGSTKSTLEQVREESNNDENETEQFGQMFLRQSGLSTDDSGFYNFDDTPSHSSQEIYPSPKKARSADTPSSSTAPILSRRLNSLSKKFKTRTGAGPKLSIEVAASKPARSRTGSAASAIMSPAVGAVSQQETRLPPSPAHTLFEEPAHETFVSSIDIDKANACQEEDVVQARTPLLPPMLTTVASRKESPVQSPLQSPTIAGTGFYSESNTPVETPRMCSLPSPPLSTKPSIASLRQRSRAGTLIPSADIPPMIIDAVEEDSWSLQLGHANFTILPQPYLPDELNLEACKQFRDDYERAKANYAEHLARTGENSGPTSRVYKLTEGKWTDILMEWEAFDSVVSSAIGQFEQQQDAVMMELAHSNSDIAPMPQIPATDMVTGKFPVLDDEDIVGRMSVAPALKRFLSHEPQLQMSKKRTFLKLISDLLTRGNVRA